MIQESIFASRQKFMVSLLVILSVAIVFWSGSRVPQLNEKATMGAETNINALGFDTVFVIQPNDSTLKKIAYTTVNWVDTNKKGMTFGVLFAACLMTGFAVLRRRAFQSGFANSALGLVMGAPLGVCVNCAAPIATGLSAAGTRIETTLATMTSSPTMNFIVLGMLFSLFPLYFVAIKLALVVGFILIGIPLITRLFLKSEAATLDANQKAGIFANKECPIPSLESIPVMEEGWLKSFAWFGKSFAKNLWFIIKNTVPLMLLAGMLGAIIVTILPWDSLAELIPGDTTATRMASMFVVGIIGAFLPVPIAFDVVICAVLLSAGMPARYVMVLLFTLGIYSVYSYFIVSQAISKKAASLMFVGVVFTGVLGGYVANEFHKIDVKERRDFFISFFVEQEQMSEPTFRFLEAEQPPAQDTTVAPLTFDEVDTKTMSGPGVAVSAIRFNDRSPAEGRFIRRFGDEIGLQIPYDFSFFKMELPFVQGYGRTVSSGDLNGDDRPDLLFLTESGIHKYLATGPFKFKRVPIDLGKIGDMELVNAAIADVNGDGWNDIFLATYLNGNYIAYSNSGKFSASSVEALPRFDGEHLSPSVAFGDVDEDGDLDMIVGNWSVGWGEGTWIAADATRNTILFQEDGKWRVEALPMPSSIPTSILLSDLNRDSHLDLIIGNDFGPPDYFYFGNGDGTFTPLDRSSGVFPASGYDVMSVSTSDLDNDLRPDILMAEIAYYDDNHVTFGSRAFEDICVELAGTEYETRCLQDARMHTLFTDIKRTQEVSRCESIDDKRLREECVVLFVSRRPPDRGGYATAESCALLPDQWTTTKEMCLSSVAKGIELPKSFWDEAIPQLQQKNVLLFANEDGQFIDQALEWGVQQAGWAWNSKFFDADLDGFNDLLVANGTFNSNRRRESNYFYLNEEGRRLRNVTDETGMTTYLAYSSYTLLDADFDGDQDVIAIPINGPVSIFENRMSDNASIAVDIRNADGNINAIGAEVIVRHAGSNAQQLKEISASGGFVSFDVPEAYFGLGSDAGVEEVRVRWPDGQESVITGQFDAGYKFRIRRIADTSLLAGGNTPVEVGAN